ncbi:UDP-N-acetylmuramoyl-tripeptide--D-alanyl-D-alanine ligase [Williamsia muralis]|uniref:UDP-N-acetylmuramoyl-tripeptide--D-alanyl-D- alanine ligase n=1 Tax=Williamsia marianensis TaxID=85044 RepID=UPI000E326772|nr:UDP-N-acetylmuramoyl-tripeptide--D-alanyl-D-alanine ligase [Williamsia marianensis]
MRFKASDVAAATGGRLIGPDTTIDGASIDSRSVRPDQLFVPIVAERDGHDFIGKAREAGVTTYLTSQGAEGSGTAIEVPDTALALADLGRAARERLTGPVVGVTGSVGKTSTKDLLASVLATSYVTAANERSFNNELGLPLTLLGARDDTEAVVVEMGARGVGHIALLCDIARPTVGIVTRVEGVHLELFGDIESVARAKGELIEALPDDGLAVLNNDHPLVVAMADRTSATVLRYGFTPDADVYADNISLDDELRGSFTLHSPWGSAAVTLGARGEHQISNALAAVAAAGGIGVSVDRIAAGLGEAAISGLRMELTRTEGGVLILNDAYNANPTSMAAALDSLATLAASRRVAVLGVMAELGESAPAEHLAITERARALGVEVIAVDAPDYGPDAQHVPTVEQAAAALSDLASGDAVLVKGSRVAALERVAAALSAG